MPNKFKLMLASFVMISLTGCGGGGSGSESDDLPSSSTKLLKISSLNLPENVNLSSPANVSLHASKSMAISSTQTDSCSALCAVVYALPDLYVGNTDLIQPIAEIPITSLENIELSIPTEENSEYMVIIADRSKVSHSDQILGSLSFTSPGKNVDVLPLSDIEGELEVGEVGVEADGNLELSSEYNVTEISESLISFTEADLIKKGNFDDSAKYLINVYLNSYYNTSESKYEYNRSNASSYVSCPLITEDFNTVTNCIPGENNVEFHLLDLSLSGQELSLYPPYNIYLSEGRDYNSETAEIYGPQSPLEFTALYDSAGEIVQVPLMSSSSTMGAGIWKVMQGPAEVASADFSFSMPFDASGDAKIPVPVVKLVEDTNSGKAEKIIVKYVYFNGQNYVDSDAWDDFTESYKGAFINFHFTNTSDQDTKYYSIHFEAINPEEATITEMEKSDNSHVDSPFVPVINGKQIEYDISDLDIDINWISYRIPFATQYLFEFEKNEL